MKLYLISQSINNNYDTYGAFVVCSKDEISAKRVVELGEDWWVSDIKDIKVEYLGEAKEGSVEGEILGSYRAG